MSLAPQLITPQLDTSFDHFSHLHTPAHGTTLLWERAAAGNHWHKLSPGDARIPGMLAAQHGQADRYLSANEFHGWRLVRLLKSLRCCYVDIDGCRDAEYTLAEALDTLKYAQLPPPSAVVFSGRGLHLYWFIEPVPGKALPVWQRCQDALIAALLHLGADAAAKDCTRVLRLVGSVNSKTGTIVRGLVFNPEPYGFRHLCDEILGYRQPRQPAPVRDLSVARAERGGRLRTGSIYDRWSLVYSDLLAIAEHYKHRGGIPAGHRDKWLFLSAVALSWFANPNTLERELLDIAKKWSRGLSDSEVRDAIAAPLDRAALAAEGKQVEFGGELLDPRYRFRRDTLHEWMSPIIPADLSTQLRAIVSAETKAEHERDRTRARDRVAEGRHETHKRGPKAAGEREPWLKLGISRSTYFKRKATGTL